MSGKIRILTIGHSYVVALNRAVAREVARDPDFEVTVAAPGFFHGDLRDLALEPEPAGSPLRLVELDVQWSRWTHVFRYNPGQLRHLIRDTHFDLVHAWEEPYIYAGYQIARCLGGTMTPLCFFTFQNLSKRLPQPFRHFERAALARSQGWIAGGRLVFEAMRSRGYPEESGRIVTPAVDTAAFAPLDEARRGSVRGRLGLCAPLIGFTGRLTSEKGISVLMKAMDRVGGVRPWSLLLLGSGPMRDEILRWAAARGWAERVRVLLARHDEVPDYLAAMDLLVAPSQTTGRWKEQFGRMLIEAFACGVPVIGSDSGEIPYVVGDAGRVIPERDVGAWADAIVELLERHELRADMAQLGLRRCQDYAVGKIAEQYRDFYRWLAVRPVH
jgi:glycosyltransferase involved in cell wall biosynthesis